jgi:3-keto-disaccharide hydrolase
MKMIARLAAMGLVAAACSRGMNASGSDGWISLFDGQTLSGWRASENPATFRVENGEIVVHGPRAHLFYEGPVMNHEFKDFELKADVLTKPSANSGIFIRTEFQPTGWPSKGYEVQVNNSQSDWRRTGSLYAVQDVREAGRDNEWFTMHTIVRGRRVQIMVDGRQVVDYTEPEGSATRLTGGTIALQGHDPGSEVHYKNIMIRPIAP